MALVSSENHVVADRIFGVCMVLLAIAYGSLTQNFEEPFGVGESIGPKTFPLILSVLLGLSGAWLAIKPLPGLSWPSPRLWGELLINIAALFLYAFMLEKAGFLVTSITCCTFLSWRMGARPLIAFGVALLYCLGLYMLFHYALELALPQGVLG